MKALLKLVSLLILLRVVPDGLRAQIPVTDVTNLTNNTVLHAENIAKWVDSINNLRTQIDQLRVQINIQDDIRRWSGNPVEAGAKVVLEGLGRGDLVRDYGRAKRAVVGLVGSLDSLKRTAEGNYRAISNLDLNGKAFKRDEPTFRRYAVLDAKQEVSAEVATETRARELELQEEIAATLNEMRAAPTDAEVLKHTAKLTALNGQLAQLDGARRREVDEVVLQKIANDARLEQERLAAAELAARDDYLVQQRVSGYLNTVKVRKNEIK